MLLCGTQSSPLTCARGADRALRCAVKAGETCFATLTAQSGLETGRPVKLIDGNPTLAGTLPGAGDLYVTILGGRIRRLGLLFRRSIPFAEAREMLHGVTLEAVAIIRCVANALRHWAERGELRLTDYPLRLHMDAILRENADPVPPFEQFG